MADVITISLASGVRTNGDVVSGILHLNVRLAEEKNVKAVRINSRGEIQTHVTVSRSDVAADGESTSICYERVWETVQLFNLEAIVIWTRGVPLPPGSSEIASFPFSFTMPLGELPPSFEGGDLQSGGSVKYFVHAVAERKSWYQRNVRTNKAFTFLPTDHISDLYMILPNWPGEWKIFGESKKMRTGIVFYDGHVQADFSMPVLPSIPLFQRIPIKLRIICSSRSFPTSAATDISKFEFPRNPSLEECELVLHQTCEVQARGSSGKFSNNLGLQGGFGKPNDKELRAAWGDQVEKSTSSPYWVVNEEDKNKGRWREDVTFSSSITFRCPPPFKAHNIDTSVCLVLEIYFAGLGNNVTLNIGPLPLSSGVASQHCKQNLNDWKSLPAEKTTPQAHCSSPRDLDLPPSYCDTILSDEKEQH